MPPSRSCRCLIPQPPYHQSPLASIHLLPQLPTTKVGITILSNNSTILIATISVLPYFSWRKVLIFSPEIKLQRCLLVQFYQLGFPHNQFTNMNLFTKHNSDHVTLQQAIHQPISIPKVWCKYQQARQPKPSIVAYLRQATTYHHPPSWLPPLPNGCCTCQDNKLEQ